MAIAVFLDKDGTLIRDVPYNVRPELIELEEEADVALPMFAAAGYRLIVVSNQSGVARGYFAEHDLTGVRQRLERLLQELGVSLAGFYYCPHLPPDAQSGAGCDCRKPAPGLLYRAASEQGIALSASWLLGDILDDVEAGRRAGCRTILVDRGHETEWRQDIPQRRADFVVSNLAEAARVVLSAPPIRPAHLARST